MNTAHSGRRSDVFSRFFWTLSFKNRQILIPTLIVMILIGALFLTRNYISMEMQLKKLKKYEPIYVLAVNRDLNVGDLVRAEDLSPMVFYKQEYEKFNFTEPGASVAIPSFIQCNKDDSRLSGFKDVIGRVVNVPVHANSMLRREFFAPRGTLPGLINLVEERHTLLDVEVPQSGFNVFVKPSDYVDLYELTKESTRLLASKVKVILVDSLALGQAPLQVAVDSHALRHLTLAIPEDLYSSVAKAKLNKALVLTYKHKVTNSHQPQISYKTPSHSKATPAKAKDLFQSLTLIQGAKKEVLEQ